MKELQSGVTSMGPLITTTFTRMIKIRSFGPKKEPF